MDDDIIRNGDLVEFVGMDPDPENMMFILRQHFVIGCVYKVNNVVPTSRQGYYGPFLVIENVHPFTIPGIGTSEGTNANVFKKVPYLKKASKQINWSDVGIKIEA